MPEQRFKGVFSLEMTRNNGKIKISAYEKSYEDEKTIKHYEFKDICENEIKKICSSVVNLLNRANRNGEMKKHTLKELQTLGQLLYDSLFTSRVKEKLAKTFSNYLIVSIDDHLVQIPWELLFDGNSFLCQRFNMGRIVSTSQNTSEPILRNIEKPLKILIIADPRGDLKASYTEGIRLRDELDNKQKLAEVDLRVCDITVGFVKGTLRDYDIVHYAGHADYDLQNPSNSGFLLEDGKLKALDIINMIGPRPLPALVFSNACKSGHTDMWKVGKDYETEIYGLANAFLLAGVQHYIGTFWDVQDEPSLLFAVDFYKELINGAVVGEAIRKARYRLIERYGEDNIIWASYMLYGDPTVRYVGREEIEREEVSEKEDTDESEKRVFRGSVKNLEGLFPVSSKRIYWAFIGFIFFLVSIILGFFIFKTQKIFFYPKSSVTKDTESRERRAKRVDELVASLIRDYKERQKTGKITKKKIPPTAPPTLVFLDIKTYGFSESDKEYILSGIINLLQDSKRVHIVEREVLDRLLEELKLSSSQLADQATALEIGRILSAKLITFGSILREKRNWQVNLRMIETETTSIKVALSKNIEIEEKGGVAEWIGQEILKKIKIEYPLRGRIISIEGDKVALNIGYNNGATKGLKMKVLSEKDSMPIGEIMIISEEKNRSIAEIIKKNSKFQKGLNTEEIL